MNDDKQAIGNGIPRDPLGLADLPHINPDHDDWSAIRAAIEADTADRHGDQPTQRPGWRRFGGLAAAASLVLAVVLSLGQQDAPGPTASPLATPTVAVNGDVDELIAMSQVLETRLRRLRADTGALPARSVLWVSELEDMIARVDGELSMAPESVDLWGQRVNLLLDVESIYVHQFEREYGRMASL